MTCYGIVNFRLGDREQKEAAVLPVPAGGEGGELAFFVLPLVVLGMDCLLTC